MNQEKISRRDFINYILSGGFLAFLLSATYPLLRYIHPPKGVETVVSSVVAAKVGELPPNSGKVFRFGDKPGILINTSKGELLAYNAVCTHLNCTVQFMSESSHIWCACHNGHFDLNGQVISGPPPRPLERYKVNVRGTDIVVSKSA